MTQNFRSLWTMWSTSFTHIFLINNTRSLYLMWSTMCGKTHFYTRCCVSHSVGWGILHPCYCGVIRGHFSANWTIVYDLEAGFFWPSMFHNALKFVDCRFLWSMSKERELIQVWWDEAKSYSTMWSIWCVGNRFHGTISKFQRQQVWVEAQALPNNDGQVMVKFLKKLFSQFGFTRVIICDQRTHFYNTQFGKVMKK